MASEQFVILSSRVVLIDSFCFVFPVSFTSLSKIQGEFFFRGNEILIDNYVSSTELTKMVSEHFIDHVSILPDPNYF